MSVFASLFGLFCHLQYPVVCSYKLWLGCWGVFSSQSHVIVHNYNDLVYINHWSMATTYHIPMRRNYIL